MVGRRRDPGVARQKGDAFRQGIPSQDPPAGAATAPADFELVGVVDHSLDPQHAAVLVVHLDPVGLHPVLHSGARPAALPVVHDLAGESAVELAAEEREDVLGAQAERRMAQ